MKLDRCAFSCRTTRPSARLAGALHGCSDAACVAAAVAGGVLSVLHFFKILARVSEHPCPVSHAGPLSSQNSFAFEALDSRTPVAMFNRSVCWRFLLEVRAGALCLWAYRWCFLKALRLV